MSARKEEGIDLPTTSTKSRDSQGSPLAIAAIALAGSIGYFSWKVWKRWQEEKSAREDAGGAAGLSQDESQASTKSKSKGSPFSFDKQPKSAVSTCGRQAPGASSSASSGRRPSRQDPKPKSQKQLRKEAKQAKKEAREQAARDAEGAAVSAAIAKRAKELGMGQQPPPEPQKQYYVDYDGVSKGYDKIVEWQQTGKKKY